MPVRVGPAEERGERDQERMRVFAVRMHVPAVSRRGFQNGPLRHPERAEPVEDPPDASFRNELGENGREIRAEDFVLERAVRAAQRRPVLRPHQFRTEPENRLRFPKAPRRAPPADDAHDQTPRTETPSSQTRHKPDRHAPQQTETVAEHVRPERAEAARDVRLLPHRPQRNAPREAPDRFQKQTARALPHGKPIHRNEMLLRRAGLLERPVARGANNVPAIVGLEPQPRHGKITAGRVIMRLRAVFIFYRLLTFVWACVTISVDQWLWILVVVIRLVRAGEPTVRARFSYLFCFRRTKRWRRC